MRRIRGCHARVAAPVPVRGHEPAVGRGRCLAGETSMNARNALASTFDRANSDVVLIVDDVPDNLSVLHDALDESGYTVLVAINGESALQRARQSLPDVILLD